MNKAVSNLILGTLGSLGISLIVGLGYPDGLGYVIAAFAIVAGLISLIAADTTEHRIGFGLLGIGTGSLLVFIYKLIAIYPSIPHVKW